MARSRTVFLAAAAVVVAAGAAVIGIGAAAGTHSAHAAGSRAAAMTSNAATVRTATTSVGTVLVGANGRTLYHLTSEDGGKIRCTGACLRFWPPLLAPRGHAATLAASAQGTLGVITRPTGGRQVTFDGMPLYYFAGDKAPGDVAGQGISAGNLGTWFVVIAGGSAGSGASSSPAPSTAASGSGGYGY